MAIVLVTGGTGLTGTALTEALIEKGHEVIILTRNPGDHSTSNSKVSYAAWDPGKRMISAEAIGKADHIIHLAGAGIADKRWTTKRKQEIVNSRVASAALIVESLVTIPNHVQTVMTASAIGWYGPDPAGGTDPSIEPFVETDPPAKDFLGETCHQWEAAIEPAAQLGKRVIKFRTGIILSPSGGALNEFKKPLRFGIAAIMGSGRQITSWIHIDDLVRMYIRAIEDEKIAGVYNAVAPERVSNKNFILALARYKNRFFIPVHIPPFVLKIVLGEMSIEVLKSATVSSGKIEQTGFVFKYPRLEDAMKAVVSKS